MPEPKPKRRRLKPAMLKVNSYTVKGVKQPVFTLPKIFEAKGNPRFLAQAIRVYEDRTHAGLAKVKTRAEVNRTKKKVYKQKGTGGARHGSRSAPIYVGGGVAHGPKGIKRQLSLPRSLRLKALSVIISSKVKNGEIVVVDGISKLNKTKDANNLLNKLSKEGVKKFTFVLDEKNLGLKKVLRNLKNVNLIPGKNLNAYEAFLGGLLVFDKEIFAKNKK